MRRARIKRTGHPVYADEIDGQPSWRGEDLVCWERGCDSAVRAIGGYTKRDGTPYSAHFRLSANGEHGDGCPLNPVAVITAIAQGSEGFATVDQGVLRLTLPQDLSAPAVHDPGLDGAPVDGDVVGRRITTVPPLLPPLINSAAKIVRFLIAHDFDAAIVNRFRVLPYGATKPVLWEKFCYGPTYSSYSALYTLVRVGKRPSPVAVYGTVQHVRRDRNGRPYAVIATADPTGVLRFEVVLRSAFPSLLAPLREGVHVLAVGAWDVWAEGRTPQLRLFAGEHWQIAYWTSDEATGEVSEPACPAALTASQRATARPAGRPPAPSGSSPTGRRAGSAPPRRARSLTTSSPSSAGSPRTRAPRSAAPTPPRPVTQADGPAAAGPVTPSVPGAGESNPVLPAPQPAPNSPGADDRESAALPQAPSVPPRPALPPRPSAPPRRRRGLADWLGRRKRRR
ncbi:hypothetical protein ACJ6WF_41400 [Streptomyces sp. MMS24-I2-30]|uniref:hypothetical protein n=1 Tax=Streptomyces sp. MMS24-I2-30 TaxID=3351564 RepID=UPI0038969BD6